MAANFEHEEVTNNKLQYKFEKDLIENGNGNARALTDIFPIF